MLSSVNNHKVSAIVLAGGSGSRMSASVTKQKMLIKGVSVLKRSVLAFEHCNDIDEIIVIVREDEVDFAKEELKDIKKLSRIGIGGVTRAESAECGFKLVSECSEYVAIHDAARPLVTPEMISEVVAAAKKKGAATAAAPVVDTIKLINNVGNIISTPARNMLIRATTPQIFRKDIYSLALGKIVDKSNITDDNMLVESIGVDVFAVVQKQDNPKVTSRSDLIFIEALLEMEETYDRF